MKFFTFLFAGFYFILPLAAEAKKPVYAATYQKAKKLYEKKKYNEARTLFSAVKDMAKNDKSYYVIYDYRIGICYYGEGNYEKAIEHLKIYLGAASLPKSWPTKKQVRKLIKKAKNEMKRISNVKDKDKLAQRRKSMEQKIEKHKEMGEQYYDKEKYNLAKNQYYSAYTLTKKFEGQTRNYYYYAYKIAKCYEKMKNLKMAIRYYKKYMGIGGGHNKLKSMHYGWPSRAKIRSLINHYENLLKKENASNVSYSNNYNKVISQADKLASQGKFEKAAVKYEQAKKISLRQNNYSRLIDYMIGSAWQRAGKPRKAIKAYKIYLKAKYISSGWPHTGEVSGRIRMLKQNLDRGYAFSGSSKGKGKGSQSDDQDDDFRGHGKNNYGSGPIKDDIDSETKWFNSWWFYTAVGVATLLVIGVTFSGGIYSPAFSTYSTDPAAPANGHELFRF
ncbi:MAG: tetratricopeptide repeat protein [Myxococcota bacterium]